MYRILLACAAGMSTSMLVEKMKSSAKERGIEVEIEAVPDGKAESIFMDYQVVLLGPQVGHLEAKFRARTEPKGIPTEVINMMDYGMMNGAKVLDRAIELIDKGEK